MDRKRKTGYRTNIEHLAEQVLVEFNLSYIFEHKVSRYSIDFALPQLMIALECDGFFHTTAKRQEADKKRDEALSRLGWTTVRIPGPELVKDARSAILNALKCSLSPTL